MNDRYLFRGKREKDEQWEYGAFWQSNSSIIDKSGYSQKVIPETVGQCTGLKDKNGKLIFEGDIFRYKYEYDYQPVYGVVHYQNDYDQYRRHNPCGYVIKWQIITRTAKELREDLPFWCGIQSNAEVCGNYHDNPELLEVKE